jgi:thermitase
MKRFFILVFIGLLSVFQFSFPHSNFSLYHQGEPIKIQPSGAYVPDQIVVKLVSPELPKRSITQKLKSRYRAEIQAIDFHSLTGYHVLHLFPGTDAGKLLAVLSADPLVAEVSLNYYAGLQLEEPNDPFFHFQYALFNYGQIYYPESRVSGTIGSDIKALEGWDWSMGTSEVIIAIVDTGVALNHEDLVNKIVPGYDFIHDRIDAADDNGHGTLVASIASAETNNNFGSAGVCWMSRIMPVKCFDSVGNGDYLAIAAGIRFAVDHGAQVINLSFGGENDSFILRDACRYAFENGCVLVAATGNESSDVLFPARYDAYCIAVGASDARDFIASWSNQGPQVDVVAPGVYVFGALFLPDEPDNLQAYGWGSGTSFAAPHVSGAAALLLSYKPFLSSSQVMDLIKYTSDDVNDTLYPGVDEVMGYGRINLKTLLGPFPID